MKRLFILFISIVVFMPVAYNQNSYLIEYDKPTDKFTYKSKTLAGKKQVEKVIKNLPKLQEGDVVTVHVKNYNPFLYYVDITSSELIEESSSSADNSGAMSMLNMITGGLNPISSFLGTLSDVEGMFNSRGDGAAMGEEEYDEPEVMHPDEFAHFETNQGIISELIKDYNTKYENYLNWDNTPRPGERSHDIRVDSVDFNHDGLLDVVVFSTGWPVEGSWPDISTVQLLQNNGDGLFVDVTDDLLEGYNIDSNSSYATVFADFNDDGWVDMLVSDSDWNTPNNSTAFILSNGDGTFSEQGRDIIAGLNDASSGMGTTLQDSEGQVYLILAEQFIYQGNSFSDPTFETVTVIICSVELVPSAAVIVAV